MIGQRSETAEPRAGAVEPRQLRQHEWRRLLRAQRQGAASRWRRARSEAGRTRCASYPRGVRLGCGSRSRWLRTSDPPCQYNQSHESRRPPRGYRARRRLRRGGRTRRRRHRGAAGNPPRVGRVRHHHAHARLRRAAGSGFSPVRADRHAPDQVGSIGTAPTTTAARSATSSTCG